MSEATDTSVKTSSRYRDGPAAARVANNGTMNKENIRNLNFKSMTLPLIPRSIALPMWYNNTQDPEGLLGIFAHRFVFIL